MPVGWTSWALTRLDLGPAQLVEEVVRRCGLPSTPEAREVVELHLATLDVSLDVGSPALLVPQLRWELTRWPQVAPGPRWTSVSEAVVEVLTDRLDELTCSAVVRHLDAAEAGADSDEGRAWAQRGRAGLTALTGPVQAYLGHAVAGRHDRAIDHLLRLADRGMPVGDLLMDVIAPAQQELGRLWERGVLDVAQEHVATSVTQVTMSSLHLRLVGEPRAGSTLVAATPPGDTHEVGLRIVTDLLRLHGWDTVWLGTSCPVPDVLDAVASSGASLLLLGASMTLHLPGLREAVEQVRADPRCDDVRVMVGGEPFRHAPTLGAWVGADLVATTATEAVEAAEGLLAPAAPTPGGSIS